MKKTQKTIVISLGGSIVNPGEIQVDFLKDFKKLILRFLNKDFRFIIVVGGGSIARSYQKAASLVSPISNEDKDWLGIHATRINAHLLRTIFKKEAYPVVLDSPHKPVDGRKHRLYIASGWRPGWSTDYVAVLLAQRFKAEKLVNASNIAQVYDENKEFVKEVSWRKYRKLIGKEWIPGMNVPFDPVASQAAEKAKMSVYFVKGTDLGNLTNVLGDKPFLGTVIHP